VKIFKRFLAVGVTIATVVNIITLSVIGSYFLIPLGVVGYAVISPIFSCTMGAIITYYTCMKVIFPLWDDRDEYKNLDKIT
jgi:hypothetical protein